MLQTKTNNNNNIQAPLLLPFLLPLFLFFFPAFFFYLLGPTTLRFKSASLFRALQVLHILWKRFVDFAVRVHQLRAFACKRACPKEKEKEKKRKKRGGDDHNVARPPARLSLPAVDVVSAGEEAPSGTRVQKILHGGRALQAGLRCSKAQRAHVLPVIIA
jgi:hypothetical protein